MNGAPRGIRRRILSSAAIPVGVAFSAKFIVIVMEALLERLQFVFQRRDVIFDFVQQGFQLFRRESKVFKLVALHGYSSPRLRGRFWAASGRERGAFLKVTSRTWRGRWTFLLP